MTTTNIKDDKPMRVCVYCASSNQIDDVFFDDARELGRLMSVNKMELMYGGGGFGLMGAVCDAVQENGGKAVGVIPQFMIDKGWLRPGLDEVICVETMYQRKQQMAESSDAAVILAGGLGTLDEFFDILAQKKLGLYLKPIVILNTNHFYDSMLQQLDHLMDKSFLSHKFAQLWQVAETPAQTIDFLHQAGKIQPCEDDMLF